MSEIVAYRHQAKPFADMGVAKDALDDFIAANPKGRWIYDGMVNMPDGYYVSLRHIYGGSPQWLSNQ